MTSDALFLSAQTKQRSFAGQLARLFFFCRVHFLVEALLFGVTWLTAQIAELALCV
jgi:hypothetical protein